MHLKQSLVYLDTLLILITLQICLDEYQSRYSLKGIVFLVTMKSNESDIFLKDFHGSSGKMKNEDSSNVDIEGRELVYKDILREHSHADILQWLRDKNLGNITWL